MQNLLFFLPHHKKIKADRVDCIKFVKFYLKEEMIQTKEKNEKNFTVETFGI